MGKNITITDVAESLGVSKTTVSRAISGKGRIGEATRLRVLEYIEQHDYKPNVIAKSLAQSKTFNICVVMPRDFALMDLAFFQSAILGIQEVAGEKEYDILLCVCDENDISGLERIIDNRKVDGVILLRTYVNDLQIEFLSSRDIPFVATGSSRYEGVHCIDHDHKNACRELTLEILSKENHRVALLGGLETAVVNQNRYSGVVDAFEQKGRELDTSLVRMNLEGKEQIGKAVDEILELQPDCILCMDDAICSQVLVKLRIAHISVPDQVRIASFYNSSVLENNVPSITSLSFHERELGMEACKNLLAQIEGEEAADEMLLSYEVVLKESTR